jgi:two-component system NtrC family sensor kinase
MSHNALSWRRLFSKVNLWFSNPEEGPLRYRALRRNMIIIMVLVTLLPLSMMAVINHYEYQQALRREIISPMRTLVSKTKHSFELFLTERLSAVSFIASAYSFQDLSDQNTLNRIFRVMKQEFGGFVDLGLIDASGVQVSYVGPYELKGKEYKDHDWFHEVSVRGSHISDVFMGYRKFPHFIIAVQSESAAEERWILRATIDTDTFINLIASMGLDPASDAFIINRSGVLQTSSRFYGDVLEKFPFSLPPVSYESNVLEMPDHKGRDILLAYADFESPSFLLALVKPRSEVLRSWYTLKSEIFFIFVASVLIIFLVVFKLTDVLVKRVEESEMRQQMTYREVEHTNKLASIGRLAAGVAHEINNPLAIINEKSGLMEDLIGSVSDFPRKEKFLQLTESIRQSVDRCSTITHRLLGFARRMDVEIGVIDLNEVISEVYGFLEKEAFHRDIEVQLQLADNLPKISSDHGQLQQVFLNILNNAFAAVDDGGTVIIRSWESDGHTVAVSMQDDGVGMSEETRKHIFEPFFSGRTGHGTGLGLSITYGIVDKLGGRIDVESEEGQGTTFTVFLPKKSQEGKK